MSQHYSPQKTNSSTEEELPPPPPELSRGPESKVLNARPEKPVDRVDRLERTVQNVHTYTVNRGTPPAASYDKELPPPVSILLFVYSYLLSVFWYAIYREFSVKGHGFLKNISNINFWITIFL